MSQVREKMDALLSKTGEYRQDERERIKSADAQLRKALLTKAFADHPVMSEIRSLFQTEITEINRSLSGKMALASVDERRTLVANRDALLKVLNVFSRKQHTIESIERYLDEELGGNYPHGSSSQ